MEQWRGRVASDLKLAKGKGEDVVQCSLEVIAIKVVTQKLFNNTLKHAQLILQKGGRRLVG